MTNEVLVLCAVQERTQQARRVALSECIKALGGACQACPFRDVSGCEGRRCSVWRIQESIDKLRRRLHRKCANPARRLDSWTLDEIAAVMPTTRKEVNQ